MTMMIDPFLPRIVELAESANDRQVKIAACEVLHSVILYLFGTNASSSARREESTAVSFYLSPFIYLFVY